MEGEVEMAGMAVQVLVPVLEHQEGKVDTMVYMEKGFRLITRPLPPTRVVGSDLMAAMGKGVEILRQLEMCMFWEQLRLVLKVVTQEVLVWLEIKAIQGLP